MNRHGYVLYLVLLVVLSGTPASAELYQYTDKKGNVVFSDNPPAGVKATVKPLRQEGVYRTQGGTQHTPPQEEASSPDAAETRPYRKPYAGFDVIMYSTSWCGYCTRARSLINSLGVSFTEYDIGTVPGKREEMRRKSGGSRGVPLIDVEGMIIRGYNPGAIKAAVEKARTMKQ